jgi:hypothetical protein
MRAPLIALLLAAGGAPSRAAEWQVAVRWSQVTDALGGRGGVYYPFVAPGSADGEWWVASAMPPYSAALWDSLSGKLRAAIRLTPPETQGEARQPYPECVFADRDGRLCVMWGWWAGSECRHELRAYTADGKAEVLLGSMPGPRPGSSVGDATALDTGNIAVCWESGRDEPAWVTVYSSDGQHLWERPSGGESTFGKLAPGSARGGLLVEERGGVSSVGTRVLAIDRHGEVTHTIALPGGRFLGSAGSGSGLLTLDLREDQRVARDGRRYAQAGLWGDPLLAAGRAILVSTAQGDRPRSCRLPRLPESRRWWWALAVAGDGSVAALEVWVADDPPLHRWRIWLLAGAGCGNQPVPTDPRLRAGSVGPWR